MSNTINDSSVLKIHFKNLSDNCCWQKTMQSNIAHGSQAQPTPVLTFHPLAFGVFGESCPFDKIIQTLLLDEFHDFRCDLFAQFPAKHTIEVHCEKEERNPGKYASHTHIHSIFERGFPVYMYQRDTNDSHSILCKSLTQCTQEGRWRDGTQTPLQPLAHTPTKSAGLWTVSIFEEGKPKFFLWSS